MSAALQMADRPALAPGYRFQWEAAQQAHVLLYPEGMVTLSGSAGEILKRCDGERSVEQICVDLEIAFPGADLRGDVLEFIADARDRGWLRVDG